MVTKALADKFGKFRRRRSGKKSGFDKVYRIAPTPETVVARALLCLAEYGNADGAAGADPRLKSILVSTPRPNYAPGRRRGDPQQPAHGSQSIWVLDGPRETGPGPHERREGRLQVQ